ncbi:MAG: ribonuclease H-like domain-containing protein [Oligoflexales bacterium]|nr:ribonuclease H-like domain-containing protein [Oligoflexales bacterium]
MLEHSFLHCRGIAKATEKRLHSAGFLRWDHALEEPNKLPLGPKRRNSFVDELKSSQDALRQNNMHYFLSRLPKEERWRVLAEFYPDASFLDIETTGFSPYSADITIISLLHRGKVHLFIKGQNLKKIIALFSEIKLLVTFCGSNFDIPFLLESFRFESLPCPHVDLRWQSYYLGWTGGLKKIEQELGFARPKKYQEMSGSDAIELWSQFSHNKSTEILKKLKAYSILDVLSLQLLMLHLLEERNPCFSFPELTGLKSNFSSQDYIEGLLS